jgi:hypothetical protein
VLWGDVAPMIGERIHTTVIPAFVDTDEVPTTALDYSPFKTVWSDAAAAAPRREARQTTR